MAKSVLITGASRGLGEGLARQFAQRGYKLALTARKIEDLEPLARDLQGSAAQIAIRSLDVIEYDSIPGVIKECAEELGGLDIIIANAGIVFRTPVGQGHFEAIRSTIDVNLTGAIATAEAAVELFREQGHGQLVGISSVAALRGMKNQSAYCATKAAIGTYLESVRCDTFGENISVTELAPGYIDTDLNRGLASRPFVIDAQKGTAMMVDLIETKKAFSYVPPWPWRLVAQFMKILPVSKLSSM